ncbi:MAG: hypothetical protein A2X86_22395 [Bdellovibrionales bacterium GWA2_49_15]|nr:MAG: hypothetical protein A2X86_22395 [Bdellovibrionales bacterium GWA2_49_15]HAZ14770.1 hypothetical protein [Bdellovibrionales bacterium]
MLKKMLVLVLFALCSFSALAEMKVSTLAFGDYYWNKHSETGAVNGQHGLAFRRIYLTLDNAFDDNHSGKLQLEANQAAPSAAAATMTPYVKQANVTRKIGDHAVAVGIVGTPALTAAESSWGYRDVEKTPLDLLGWVGSVDGGISVKGSFMEKMLMYHVLYGNGAKNNQETDKYKEMYGSLGVAPIKNLLVEVYYDKKESFKGLTDATINQLFVGYKMEGLRVGAQYATYVLKTQSAGVATADKKANVISAHVAKSFGEEAAWSVFGRYDMIEYKTDASVAATNLYYMSTQTSAKKLNVMILGADYKDGDNFHIIPNVERVSYSTLTATASAAGTPKPKAEEIVKITFSYKF